MLGMQQQELTILPPKLICSNCQKPTNRLIKSGCGTCYAKQHRNTTKNGKASKSVYDCTDKARYSRLKSSAKKRNLECSLTFDQFVSVTSHHPCFYCGGRLGETGHGLDRANNEKGYTPENSLPCCGSCNSMKGDELTADEMLFVAAILKSVRGGKFFYHVKTPTCAKILVSIPITKLQEEGAVKKAIATIQDA